MTPTAVVSLLLLAAEPAVAGHTPSAPAPLYERRGVTGPREVEPGCVRAAFRVPEGADPTGTVTLKFSVSAVGAPGDFTSAGDAAPLVHDALVAAVRSCAWIPGKADGNPAAVWRVMPFKFRDGPAELEAAERWERTRLVRKVELAEPGCVARRFRAPEGSLLTGEVKVLVRVGPDGAVVGVLFPPGKLPDGVAPAIEAAVRACAWRPAETRDGPVAAAVTLPIRFDGPPLPAADPGLARPAREKQEGCLRRRLDARLGAVPYRTVVISFRVAEDGTPGQVAVWPEGVDANHRVVITDAVAACLWVPGVGTDGSPRASSLVRRLEL